MNDEPRKFVLLIKLKFLFLIIKLILILSVYLTCDENIFSGLGMFEDREGQNYKTARDIHMAGISLILIGSIMELLIVFVGYTVNFHKNNILILSLNIFAIYLLGYFILGGWHYVTIWYIFIVAQLPQTCMEIYGFIYAVTYQLLKYNRIKNNLLISSNQIKS